MVRQVGFEEKDDREHHTMDLSYKAEWENSVKGKQTIRCYGDRGKLLTHISPLNYIYLYLT